MKLTHPLNFKKWIEDNRDQFRPPVGLKKIWEDSDFMVFVVGGPNARKDFHIDPSEEFFYQLEGDMVLRVEEDGELRDIEIKEGEIFLLPANMPHSPQRRANTIGLVIEHRRPEDARDGLRWYCDNCGNVLHEVWIPITDIGPQIKAAIEDFMGDMDKRTCDACGDVLQPPEPLD